MWWAYHIADSQVACMHKVYFLHVRINSFLQIILFESMKCGIVADGEGVNLKKMGETEKSVDLLAEKMDVQRAGSS